MSIKLIAVDVDGTFLSDQKTYNRERFMAQYRQMKEQGIRFVVASGNQYYQLISFFPEIAHQIAFVAENGGWVVGYENCTGAKATERCVAEEGDVYDALTDKYLAIGCSCISPNDQRLQLLSQMVEEYQADGVIDVILQACHTYAVESLAIKRHLRQQHDLPYMAIETDYSTADLGQLSTRVAAFIEML